MSDPTMLPEAPTYCPHPDCTEVLRDSDGTVHHRGGACPTHQEWFAYAVAACNAGDGGAMEAYAASDARHPEHLVIDTTEADDMSAGAIADGIVDVGGFSY